SRSYDVNDENFPVKLGAFRDAMIEQIDALSKIASEFSNFAKMPKAQNEVVNLQEIISGCFDLFDKSGGVEITYDNHIEGAALVYADKDQMIRVFNNLVKNAIQAIPKEANGAIQIRLKMQGEEVIAEVCDNGSGIPEEMRSKIFEPNFTTKSTGTGLGLAMVQNIINQANGEISFATSENKGTCFKIRLPLYSE
ncbi:MAG: two-component system nitrogen regulation sensor histidine kinase NtrY, partial [Flavobacteriales bacterium]